jgi:Protein of unknown function (DUF2914)
MPDTESTLNKIGRQYLTSRKFVIRPGIVWLLAAILVWTGAAFAQESGNEAPRADAAGPVLLQAAVCEDVRNWSPHNPAVVFSVSREKIFCFSRFDAIPSEMLIFHQWYYRDEPMIQMRLKLYPPNWSTFSSINLRESDIGPWRVEITDADNNILTVLRFSVTD